MTGSRAGLKKFDNSLETSLTRPKSQSRALETSSIFEMRRFNLLTLILSVSISPAIARTIHWEDGCTFSELDKHRCCNNGDVNLGNQICLCQWFGGSTYRWFPNGECGSGLKCTPQDGSSSATCVWLISWKHSSLQHTFNRPEVKQEWIDVVETEFPKSSASYGYMAT